MHDSSYSSWVRGGAMSIFDVQKSWETTKALHKDPTFANPLSRVTMATA